MSEENTPEIEENTEAAPSELESLKARATQMNIPFHPSIGVDKLRAKVNAAIEGVPDLSGADEPDKAEDAVITKQGPISSKANARVLAVREATKKVRINVTNMNPNTREHEGILVSVGNSVVGMHKAFVPFNVDWHVPNIIYKHLKQRKVQIFTPAKGKRKNQGSIPKIISELSIEVLEPLTKEEIAKLAQRQTAVTSLDE